jgi:tetratricopeptide (TPR) repeat protein
MSGEVLRVLRVLQVRCGIVIGFVLLASIATSPVRAQGPELSPAVKTELDQGQLLLDHKQYFEALKRLTRANQLAGDRCAECLISMAEAMQAMKSYQNALDTAAKALEIAEGNVRWTSRAHELRADIYQALAEKDASKYHDAELELRQALATDPSSRGSADVRFMLAVVLLKQSKDDEGIAELKRVAEIRPDALGDDAKALIANPRRAREHYAPEFNVVTADNQRITLASLRGKVVLLDFWATGCQPCVKALPALKKLQQTHAHDPLVVLSVSADQDDGVWRRFTVKNEMTWPQYWDRTSAFQEHFDVQDVPAYVVLDGEGIERYRLVGSGLHESRAIADAIEKALASLASAR